MKYQILSILILSIFLAGCWSDDDKDNEVITDSLRPGQGIVEYTGYEPLKNKPVKIHFYIPSETAMKDMPVLMVFPGTGRNANDYLAAWINIAKQKQIMVFALEFPSDTYSSSQYIEGGMFSGGTLLAEASWTFSVIEPLFDYIKSETGNRQQQYDMFGHSAGAQFVHRFMTFKPNNRVHRGVAANAGWYTVPDFTVDYPYGLKNSPATEAGVRTFFGKELILHLGTADTNPNDASLNHTAGADAQGLYRYARGLYYWNEVSKIKASKGYALNWEKQETPNVAHEFIKMTTAAAGFLY
ncbi:hypothetical protein [Bacteroides sp. 51]|uniref:hypothetical protein n=1 Tax=Bacteroides sp. 51 TaxID=2302938 RepID=UPI0013D39E23|nr:hypothetical protein [Bacteroides sp. 51]NDV80712.1 hypothetical protein [Bacteroides sp. 51]